MIVLGLIFGLLTILCAGFGVTRLLQARANEVWLLETVALSWIFGAGVTSLLVFFCGLILSGAALVSVVGLFALLLGGAGFAHMPRFARPRPSRGGDVILTILLLLALGGLLFYSLGTSLGWDGSFNWEIKARFAFLHQGTLPRSYFSSPSQVSSHPEYPLFIPCTQLWLDLCMGKAHQVWEKSVVTLFNVAGVLLLTSLAARMSGRRWVGSLAGIALFFLPYCASGVGGITSGYLDFPLGVLYLVAMGYLLLFLQTNDKSSLYTSAAALALLPWLKREGVFLWVIAAACGVVILLSQKDHRRLLLLVLLPGAVLLGFWRFYLHAMGAPPSHDFLPATVSSFFQHLPRLSPIAARIVGEFGNLGHWSIIWFLVALALGYLLFRARDLALLVLASAIFGPVLLYSCTYLFSAWPNFLGHMQASLPRLLLQLTPLAWLSIARALSYSLGAGTRAVISPVFIVEREKAALLPLAARQPAS